MTTQCPAFRNTDPAHALYFGEVMHERLAPVRHRFVYRVFSLLLDIDRLGDLDNLRLMSRGRFNLFSFHHADHGAADGSPLRPWIERHLREAGMDEKPSRILLLCYPRVLGYVFNPLSIYYCLDQGGEIAAVVYEVRNTFGERHAYVAPVKPGEAGIGGVRQSGPKAFHVSPFLGMDARYHFTLRRPAERLHVLIRETMAGRPVLLATFSGRRRPLSDMGLARAFVVYPLMTLKVIAAIHVEALRLWRKGLRPHTHRPAPEPGATVFVHSTEHQVSPTRTEAAE